MKIRGSLALLAMVLTLATLLSGAPLLLVAKNTENEIVAPFQGRISGGIVVWITDYPWQAALKIKKRSGTYMCGGTVITKKWVLTAAHCLLGAQKSGVQVKTGDDKYESGLPWDNVDNIVVHSGFNPTTYKNDIALIHLSVPPKGGTVPMSGASLTVPIGQELEVTGWGETEKGKISNELRMAKVPIVDNVTCNAPESYNNTVLSGMMCAGKQAVDSCSGDSGGPAIWRSSNGPVLVGVVSFGDGCAKKLKFGVYTRVSVYRNWINSIMASSSN